MWELRASLQRRRVSQENECACGNVHKKLIPRLFIKPKTRKIIVIGIMFIEGGVHSGSRVYLPVPDIVPVFSHI